MASNHESDAARKRRKRAEDRDLKISRIAEPNRRADCLADVYQFLPTYFPDVFYQPFTDARRNMVDAIEHATEYSGDQSVAGPRADGKSRNALYVALHKELSGKCFFPIIISKSGNRANRELKNLKFSIAKSETFAADFPEVVEPIVDLGGWASRGLQQTAFMQPTDIEWGTDCIILPKISSELLWENGWNSGVESCARGQITASLGIEGPIRGYNVRGHRPDVAIIDDIDDRESAKSALQTGEREQIIEEDIAGLAGPDKTISRVMLCTLINWRCIAATYTDKKKKPSWKGQRHRLIDKWPERADLWERYTSLRVERKDDDPDAREAYRFYRDNREAMDAGAVVTNPYRFDQTEMPDGEPYQISALQCCYDIIADRGREHFDTEYQNDPPEENEPVDKGITPELVQHRIGPFHHELFPDDTIAVATGIDIGKRRCHLVTVAASPGPRYWLADYKVLDVFNPDELGPEKAITQALQQWRDTLIAEPYCDVHGEVRAVDIVLMDAGDYEDAAYAMARYGLPFYASKGFGSKHKQSPFRKPKQANKDNPVVDPDARWYVSRTSKGYLACLNADFWKEYVQDRFMTDPQENGSLLLFKYSDDVAGAQTQGSSARRHRTYAESIVSEQMMEITEDGKGTFKKWVVVKSGKNHFLDATAMALAGLSMKGVKLDTGPPLSTPPAPKPKEQPKQEPVTAGHYQQPAGDAWSAQI